MKKKIVIAGATGFIGRWIIEKFKNDYEIVALSRKVDKDQEIDNVLWKKVDLYSISSTERALEGADYAIYLVHSMQPSTRLNQGEFQDTDLLLADNFSRGARKNNLKQIIYIGGILPKDKKNISKHLLSRFEVEKTLAEKKVPLTAIRAGIIIGPGGSSFKIIKNLIKNLPIMLCPKWTLSLNQPIDIFDILQIIKKCLGNKSAYNKSIEVGGSKVLSYMDLIKLTAKIMNKKRIIFSIPFFSVGLSKLWVSFFAKSSLNFVSPLVESLKHKMIPDENNMFFKLKKKDIDRSISIALTGNTIQIPKFIPVYNEKNTVRSVQRMQNPKSKKIDWIANEYPKWITNKFAGIINAKFDGTYLTFWFWKIKFLELKLIINRSDKNRQLYYITGGLLAKRTDYGWLEFRSILENKFVIVAIHEFVPKLPWFIYKYTQAIAHLYVMKGFERHIIKS